MKTVNIFSDNFTKELGELIGLPEGMQEEFRNTFDANFVITLQEFCDLKKGTVLKMNTPNGNNYFFEDWKKNNQS